VRSLKLFQHDSFRFLPRVSSLTLPSTVQYSRACSCHDGITLNTKAPAMQLPHCDASSSPTDHPECHRRRSQCRRRVSIAVMTALMSALAGDAMRDEHLRSGPLDVGSLCIAAFGVNDWRPAEIVERRLASDTKDSDGGGACWECYVHFRHRQHHS
jgi:hypothetical protein